MCFHLYIRINMGKLLLECFTDHTLISHVSCQLLIYKNRIVFIVLFTQSMSGHLDIGLRRVFKGTVLSNRLMNKGSWRLSFRWKPDMGNIGEVSYASDHSNDPHACQLRNAAQLCNLF